MDHKVIKNLAKIYIANNKDPILEKCILQLHEGALLLDGNLKSSADYVERMTQIMEEATG